MDQAIFKSAAQFIAKNNASERVVRVVATFEREVGRLKVVYWLRGEAQEEDRYDCELTCSELIAAFPEIKTAETMCLSIAEGTVNDGEIEGVVFSRE